MVLPSDPYADIEYYRFQLASRRKGLPTRLKETTCTQIQLQKMSLVVIEFVDTHDRAVRESCLRKPSQWEERSLLRELKAGVSIIQRPIRGSLTDLLDL